MAVINAATGNEEEVSIDNAAATLTEGSTPSEERAEEETQQAEGAEEATEAEEETTQPLDDGEGEGKDRDGLEKIKAFIDQTYAGNVEEFLKGVRESWRSGKELRQELDEVKAQLQRPEPEPEPDVSHIDEELEAFKQDRQSVQAEIDQNIRTHQDLNKNLARLEGKLENAIETEDKAELRSEIRDLKREISFIERDLKVQVRSDRDLDRKVKATERRREQEIANQRQQFQSRAALAEQQAAEDNNTVDSTIVELFDKYEVPENHRHRLHGLMRSEIITYLTSLGKVPALDLNQVTSVIGESLIKELKEMTKASLQKASGKKLQTSVERTRNRGTPSQPARTDKKPTSQAEWAAAAEAVRERARKLLGD